MLHRHSNGVVCFLRGYHRANRMTSINRAWYIVLNTCTPTRSNDRIRCLSYNPLAAPRSVARMMSHIHLLRFHEMPSLSPANEKR